MTELPPVFNESISNELFVQLLSCIDCSRLSPMLIQLIMSDARKRDIPFGWIPMSLIQVWTQTDDFVDEIETEDDEEPTSETQH